MRAPAEELIARVAGSQHSFGGEQSNEPHCCGLTKISPGSPKPFEELGILNKRPPPVDTIVAFTQAFMRVAFMRVLRSLRSKLNARLRRKTTVLQPHEPEVKRTFLHVVEEVHVCGISNSPCDASVGRPVQLSQTCLIIFLFLTLGLGPRD